MKTKSLLVVALALISPAIMQAQSIIGTWQLTDTKNCVEKLLKESDTEKELKEGFGSSSHSVARIMTFSEKGKGEESIKKAGKKKGEDKSTFQYKVSDGELLLLDKKSGIVTERFVIDELTDNTLKMHRPERDCEEMTFTRIK